MLTASLGAAPPSLSPSIEAHQDGVHRHDEPSHEDVGKAPLSRRTRRFTELDIPTDPVSHKTRLQQPLKPTRKEREIECKEHATREHHAPIAISKILQHGSGIGV